MKAPTIYEQTKWKRPNPNHICQDMAVLEKISEFDFDLYDPIFRNYMRERGVMGFRHFEPGRNSIKPLEWYLDLLTNWSDERILTDPEYCKSNTGHEFTKQERGQNLWIIKINRTRIQDAWEVYNNQSVTPKQNSDYPVVGFEFFTNDY